METKAYPKYKDSKMQWIENIPSSWKISKIKFHFKNSKKKTNNKNPTILSLTMQGIKIRDISTNEGQIASSYDNYTKVDVGDIVMNPMDLISGFVDCSKVEGVISPAYYTLKTLNDENTDYYNYYLQKHYYEQIFFPFAEGVSTEYRWTLKNEDLMNFPIIVPPTEEQEQIAKYLDKKTTKIEQTITKNKKLITLLKEKRTTIINQTITKGLNPDTPMKESGIDWIGKIPEHWYIIRGKPILNHLKRYVKDNDEIITCFRDGEVTTRSKRREEGFTFSDKEIGYQGIEKNDLVVHGMDGFAGAIGISDSRGKGSPVLIVLNSSQNKKYIMYYLRNLAYKNVFLALSTGIRVRSCDLNWNKLSNLEFTIPPKNEQKEIADYLDNQTQKIDKTIEKIEKNIELLEEYKESLIHHVVTGKIDVRGVEV